MKTNQLTGVMRMHLRDRWMWFYTPWVLLIFSFIVNIIISAFVSEIVYTGGIASIYVYMMVTGILTLSQYFHFALGFSVRRIDFFWGTAIIAVAISAVTGIILFLFSVIESWTAGWGVGLHFFHFSYLNDGSVLEQIWIYCSMIANMYFLGFVISSVNQRFGQTGMYIFATAAFLIISLCSFIIAHNNWWGDIFHWLSQQSAFGIALLITPVTAVYALISYFLLQRATV